MTRIAIILGALIVLAGAIAGAYWSGQRHGEQARDLEEAQSYIETRERTGNAENELDRYIDDVPWYDILSGIRDQ